MIRWIVEGRLGTAPATRVGSIDATLIDVRDLVDKVGNGPGALLRKVDDGVAALTRGDTVVVVCDLGISRSNSVAAGILAKWRGITIDAAISEMIEKTGEREVKLEVLAQLRAIAPSALPNAAPDGILVTGGTGFLGQKLHNLLSSKAAVYAPDRQEIDLLHGSVLLDRYCRERAVQTIVHLAHPRHYTNNSAMGESLTMLRNVLDVCRALGTRLILASSWVVFAGYPTEMMSAAPDATPRPKGIYSELKFLQEKLVELAKTNGEVDASVVRIAPTYGPGSDRPRLIYNFCEAIRQGKTITTHRYRGVLPRLELLYVDDAVAGLGKIALMPSQATYHLGSAVTFTPAEIARRIGVMVGRMPEIEETAIDDFVGNIVLDSSRTRELLNWRPQVDINQGLKETLNLP